MKIQYYVVALLVLIADQWTKWLIISKMAIGEAIPVINGFFYIQSQRNRGAAFSILQNQQWFFIGISLIVISVLIYYLWKLRNGKPWLLVSLALILGGATGNFLDRVRTGEVVDFLRFDFGSYTFPVFNVADSAVVVGVTMLFILQFFTPSTKSK